MQDIIFKLENIFKLEIKRGFDNRAVVGGLDKVAPIWEKEAKSQKIPDGLIQNISNGLSNYPTLSVEERKVILSNIGNYLITITKSYKNQIKQEPPSQKVIFRTKKKYKNAQSGLSAPLTVIRGIGPKTRNILSKLGLINLQDLLYFFPRRYNDYSQLKPINRIQYGEEVTIIAVVQSIKLRVTKNKKRKIIETVVSDGTGSLRLTWFNQPWIIKQLIAGTQIVISGKVNMYLGHLVMTSPEWELLEREQLHTNRIVPVYSLTARIKQKWLRRVMHQTVSFWAERTEEYLPNWIIENEGLIPLSSAIAEIHFPDSIDSLHKAKERLSFDEVFLLQLGVLQQKRNWQSAKAIKFQLDTELLKNQFSHLPYDLTNAQKSAINDICSDLNSGRQMNRLLEGDVGSGKTVIARFAIEIIIKNGAQAAFLAPTSILAEQHFQNLSRMLVDNDVLSIDEIDLLIGDTSVKEKERIRNGLDSGKVKLVIGTHALLEAPVSFKWLQLIVIDEQHRFGVTQRATLRSKGKNPHLLIMTATPIPRSLALTIYGDLDISIIDEMPIGRQPVETYLFYPSERERAYEIIKSQINKKHQAFIIYPRIENECLDSEFSAAINAYEHLKKNFFYNSNIGLLHGRMKQEEKEKTMRKFRNGEYDILVSTTVIEVGMDIPNATVVLIEGANNFGLAQLHQIRGRVGRGKDKSYCLIIPSKEDEIDNERLKIMTQTNDGFKLAEQDLKHRGPGEFLGTRQSGYSGLKLANFSDITLIERARRQAIALFDKDPDLSQPKHQKLSIELKNKWPAGFGDLS